MTRDDIIKLAREAGHAVRNIDGEDEVMDGDNYHIQTKLIERFAHLVATAEREACAKVCEEAVHNATDWDSHYWDQACINRALAIRARGNT